MQDTSDIAFEHVGWLDTATRLQRVAVVLVRHGFGELVARVGLLVPKLPGAAPAARNNERVAQRLAHVLTELGPTYIKLGQLLATRADLFSPEVVSALSALHANVRPLPFREIKKVLESELSCKLERAFAHVESKPLASASIGQVHRARLHDGTDVVIKVQRPGLHTMVAADLSIMHRVAQLLTQHVQEVAAYDPMGLVDAFGRSIRQELDFNNESANGERFRAVLGGAKEVYVPRVYTDFTRKGVLVLEFVAGARLSDLDPPARTRARAALLRAFVRQTVEHGVFHADPHPGNLLVLPDGRIVLLDLGTIDVLDDDLRRRLLRMGVALTLGMRSAVSADVVALAHRPDAKSQRSLDRAALTRDIFKVLEGASVGGSAVVEQMFQMSRTHELRLPPPLLALLRALVILDGVLRGLDPTQDLVLDVRREVAWAALRRVGRKLGHAVTWPIRWLAVRIGALSARRSTR